MKKLKIIVFCVVFSHHLLFSKYATLFNNVICNQNVMNMIIIISYWGARSSQQQKM